MLVFVCVGICMQAQSIAIENFGARPDYSGLDEGAVFRVYPQQNGTSLVEYTGKKNGYFTAAWASANDPMEFVAFKSHKNPGTYPAGGENNNYFPSLVTARYSKCIQFIDPKNIRVNFTYNGGEKMVQPNESASPKQRSFLAAGYFFRNNRLAFKQAIENKQRPGTIILQNNKTYVIKGGWAAAPGRTLRFVAANPNGIRPRIKMSHEDAFTGDAFGRGDVQDGLPNPSYLDTYGQPGWFFLPDGSSAKDVQTSSVSFEGIDIIPTTYTVPVFQYGSELGHFFMTPADGRGFSKRVLQIKDCDPLAEQQMLDKAGIVLPGKPNWTLPQFAFSNSGGVDDGKDITGMQEFKLINTSWYARSGHNVKAKYRSGNAIIIEGKSAARPAEIFVATASKKTDWYDVDIQARFGTGEAFDEQRRRLQVVSDNFSWYQVAGQDWTGGTNRNRNKFWYVEVSSGSKTFTLAFLNQAEWEQENPANPASSFGAKWAVAKGLNNGQSAEMFERIAVDGDLVPWNGNWGNPVYYGSGVKQVVAPNKLRIFGWALQKDDVVRIGNGNFTITDVTAEITGLAGDDGIMSRIITLSGNVSAAKPALVVVRSQLGPLVKNKSTVRIRPFLGRGPFGHNIYSDFNANHRYVHVRFNDDLRCTSDIPGNRKAYLYECQQYLVLDDVVMNEGRYNELSSANTLARRNELTGSKLYTIINGGSLFWNNFTGNAVKISGRPEFLYGGANWGYSKLANPVFMDDKGLKASFGLAIAINDGNMVKARNMFFDFHDIPGASNNGGRLFIDFNGMGGGIDLTGYGGTGKFKLDKNSKGPGVFPEINITCADVPVNIVGSNGRGGIEIVNNGISLKNFSLNLTSWTLTPMIYAGLFARPAVNGWPVPGAACSNPEYAKRVRINGACADMQ